MAFKTNLLFLLLLLCSLSAGLEFKSAIPPSKSRCFFEILGKVGAT